MLRNQSKFQLPKSSLHHQEFTDHGITLRHFGGQRAHEGIKSTGLKISSVQAASHDPRYSEAFHSPIKGLVSVALVLHRNYELCAV